MSGKVVLREIIDSDTDNIVKWRNSPDVKKNLYSQELLTKKQHLKWMQNNVMTGQCIQFIIEIHFNDSVQPIGTIFIKNIDRKNSKGEYGIFIGESDARGKGYSTKATFKILKYAFEVLMLNRVYLTVFSDNLAAIKSYEKSGFIKEGILKEDFYRFDGFVDVVYMGITRKIWERLN